MPSPARRLLRAALALGAVAVLATGCLPEPGPSPSTSGSAAAPTSAAPSPSGAATNDPGDAFVLPASCDVLYSPAMRARLDAELPPLNDPGTTMLSTENAVGLEILGSGAETIRCSWGPPSERGLATNVTIVTDEQRDALSAALAQAGFSAEDLDGGTIHRIEQETITQDDDVVTRGETHYLRDDTWISTRWINVSPEGYTEDIVASLGN